MDYDEKHRRYILREARRIQLKEEKKKPAPHCACGCGESTNWRPGKGWSKYRKGHHRRLERGKPPLCRCGCGELTRWAISAGRWGITLAGHSRKGVPCSDDHKKKISESTRAFHDAKRCAGNWNSLYDPKQLVPNRNDVLRSLGISLYQTYEYKTARKDLVEGKPCVRCGSTEKMHAHHRTPGDDSTLIPLCVHCHPVVHASPGAKGQAPLPNETAPLCACGCCLPVLWKRVRGWAKYRKGHGFAKIPAGTRLQDAPLCACGCGEPTTFRFGKGWNEYKTGHRQKVEGGYRIQRDGGWHEEAPLCKCGCGHKMVWRKNHGWNEYARGHNPLSRGRQPPPNQTPPLCRCGCGEPVLWLPGRGWGKCIKGHQRRKWK